MTPEQRISAKFDAEAVLNIIAPQMPEFGLGASAMATRQTAQNVLTLLAALAAKDAELERLTKESAAMQEALNAETAAMDSEITRLKAGIDALTKKPNDPQDDPMRAGYAMRELGAVLRIEGHNDRGWWCLQAADRIESLEENLAALAPPAVTSEAKEKDHA